MAVFISKFVISILADIFNAEWGCLVTAVTLIFLDRQKKKKEVSHFCDTAPVTNGRGFTQFGAVLHSLDTESDTLLSLIVSK